MNAISCLGRLGCYLMRCLSLLAGGLRPRSYVDYCDLSRSSVSSLTPWRVNPTSIRGFATRACSRPTNSCTASRGGRTRTMLVDFPFKHCSVCDYRMCVRSQAVLIQCHYRLLSLELLLLGLIFIAFAPNYQCTPCSGSAEVAPSPTPPHRRPHDRSNQY